MERSRFEADPLFERACGVLESRLEIDRRIAGDIIVRVARREALSPTELAKEIVASCTRDVSLPRELYGRGDGYESAA
jgi:hypothetical protein